MKCQSCGGQTVRKAVGKQHWLRGKLYVVEGVEAEVCRECGERYYHATMLDAVDRMLSRKHNVKGRLNVEVVNFKEVA